MPPFPPSPPPEAMLAHRGFLGALVRSLLRGADGEDDVVQETLVRAWQAGPERAGRMQAWLARIARNLSIDHLRTARRHDRLREQLPPAGESPSTADVLQREEQRQRVVHAVLALPQPYRTTVLLRYWEEVSPAQIAVRLGVPGATVRSQLKRGLAMLRGRLDAEFGGHGAWRAALLPFASPMPAAVAAASAPMPIGTLLMTKTKTLVSAAALALASLVVWLSWPSGAQPGAASVQDTAARADAVPVVVAGADQVPAADSPPAAAAEARVVAEATGELTVRGQVLHKGAPYAELTLTLQWFDGFDATGTRESEHPVRCDDEGRFAWRGPLRKAPGIVRAVAPGQPVQLWCTGEVVTPDQREVVLEVTVIPFDRVLSGRVHDTAGGPIAGARIDVNLWESSRVISDGLGRYEMRVPAPGYPLLVSASGYRQRLVQGYMPEGAVRQEFDIELVPGAMVRGRVVDEAAAPVAGAKVRASGVFHPVETDAEGRFVLDGVADDTDLGVTVAKPGFQPGSTKASVGAQPIEIVLKRGLAVDLRVVGADATPIVGAVVHVVPNAFSGWQRKGVTRSDGTFRLVDLKPGPFDVVVEKRGFESDRREVDASKAVGELAITLRPGRSVRGQVLDQAGQPVAGASIYCERGGEAIGRLAVGTRADSDVAGRFEISGLPADACTVYAHHKDYNRAALEVAGGAPQEVVLRLQRAPAVAGRVVDAATGVPVREFAVVVTANREVQALHMDPVPFKTEDGCWLVRHWQMQAGAALSVEVRAKGYAPVQVPSAAALEPPRDQNVIRLSAGMRVEGIVRDAASGRPIAGATAVLVRGEPAFTSADGAQPSDAAGRFALESVPAGEQRLMVRHADYPEVVFGPFTVGVGPGTVEVRPTLSRGVMLRGRVTGATDAAGLRVQAYRFGGRTIEAEVRADGAFELSGLGAGDTTLAITDRARRSRQLRIEVGSEAIEGFEFPLRSGSGSIRVDVVGARRGQVQVQPLDPPVGGPRIADLRSFDEPVVVVDGLAPGRYRVGVSSAEGRGSVEIEVGTGEAAVTIECRKQD